MKKSKSIQIIKQQGIAEFIKYTLNMRKNLISIFLLLIY